MEYGEKFLFWMTCHLPSHPWGIVLTEPLALSLSLPCERCRQDIYYSQWTRDTQGWGRKGDHLRLHSQPEAEWELGPFEDAVWSFQASLEVVCYWTSIYSHPFSREMFPVTLLGHYGPTFARKTNQGGWMIDTSGPCFPCKHDIQTHIHGHTSRTPILSQHCSLSFFFFFFFIDLGWCLPFQIQITKPILSGLGSKEIFFSL